MVVVVVECNADEALVMFLGVPRRAIRHERCKGNVLNRLEKADVILGVVDADPNSSQPGRLGNYVEEERYSQLGLTLLRHKQISTRRLIIIHPFLEEWLCQRAKQCGMNMGDFDLPSNGKDLHKSGRYEQEQNFHEFLEKLAETDHAFGMLKKWIGMTG